MELVGRFEGTVRYAREVKKEVERLLLKASKEIDESEKGLISSASLSARRW
jgi:hypothetical protein